ncbi:MAG: hypothetical protein EBY98_06915 [Acidimicrobiia bacterium]|jgi:hypothetical protein|nr:hypothetical protein [Acidimicrobiia bacterium]
MAVRTITDFKNRLTGGGARPNLFEVRLNFPTGVTSNSGKNDLSNFLVKTAALPASNVGPVEVPFRGRILKLSGDRTFDTWTVTVINDTDFSLRSSFEQWMNLINKHSDATGRTNPSDYMKDAYVDQLDRDGSVLRTYHFHDVFPTNVSQIDLSYDTTDTIEEFTVEFQVQWWEALKGTKGGENIV